MFSRHLGGAKSMNPKIAVAALAVLLLLAFSANALQYAGSQTQKSEIEGTTTQLEESLLYAETLESERASLQTQIVNLTRQLLVLQNQYLELSSNYSKIAFELSDLQREAENLRRNNVDLQTQLYDQGPRLITKLGTTDVRIDHTAYHSNQTRLFIEGEVWNIGGRPAINSRLHVILYQDTYATNDTYVQLGTINGLDCAYVRTDIYYYTGARLTSWKIIPEYDQQT